MYMLNDLRWREGTANAVRKAQKCATYVRCSGVRATAALSTKLAYHHEH